MRSEVFIEHEKPQNQNAFKLNMEDLDIDSDLDIDFDDLGPRESSKKKEAVVT